MNVSGNKYFRVYRRNQQSPIKNCLGMAMLVLYYPFTWLKTNLTALTHPHPAWRLLQILLNCWGPDYS